LKIIGRRDIGRVFEGSSASPDKTRGITSANFQTCANVIDEKEVLTRFVIAKNAVGKQTVGTGHLEGCHLLDNSLILD